MAWLLHDGGSMSMFLRRYFWVLNLVTIALCALFAARGFGQLAASAYQPAWQPPPPKRVDSKVLPDELDIAHVVERNIFCSTCEPEPEEPAAETPEERPVPAAENLQLVATLVARDPEWTFAAIKDTEENETGMYSIGGVVPTGATVADIRANEVLLRRGEREERLAFKKKTEKAKPQPARVRRTPRPSRRMQGLAKGIRKVGATRWEIDRKVLNKVLSNTTMIARSARIVPSVKNGKPNGFKLIRIRRGSFYSLLGMFSGDTVHAINGHPITTPDKALEIYTKLRTAGHVTIHFTRRGKRLTHEYTIR
jgi:general secretion pathway protein C